MIIDIGNTESIPGEIEVIDVKEIEREAAIFDIVVRIADTIANLILEGGYYYRYSSEQLAAALDPLDLDDVPECSNQEIMAKFKELKELIGILVMDNSVI